MAYLAVYTVFYLICIVIAGSFATDEKHKVEFGTSGAGATAVSKGVLIRRPPWGPNSTFDSIYILFFTATLVLHQVENKLRLKVL